MSTNKTPGTALESSARAIFLALLWGGAMLFVFGFWMRAKFDVAGQAKMYAFWAGGAAALALAAWQGFTLWIQNLSAEQTTDILRQQRRIESVALMAGGLGLIVMAFVLGIGKPTGGSYGFLLDNFGESVGALLFGLIALAGGYALQSPPRDEESSPLPFLADKQPIFKLLTMALCFIALGTFGYFAYHYYHQSTSASLAELTALLFFSVVCLACFLWLNTGPMNETDLRMFVLIFGGSVGMILFLLALGRAILWREDAFNLAGWQGPRGYRVWVCAYLMFVSLVLMFASFNLARADIRTNKTMRLLMYGFDTLAQVFLLFGVLASLNIVVNAMVPFTYDWSKARGLYGVSESTKKLLGGLKEETNVVVLVSQNSSTYEDLRTLLDNCQALSNYLKVEYLSPDLSSLQYERLAKRFPKILAEVRTEGRGVLVVAGPMPEKEGHSVPYEFIPEQKLFTFERGKQGRAGTKSLFKGESEIMGELKFLRQDASKRKIYVLQGYDAPSLSSQEVADRLDFRHGFGAVGIGLLAEKLKTDRYDVLGLSFQEEIVAQKDSKLVYAKEDAATKRKVVPKDCTTLIVAGVSKRLPSDVAESLENYVERGGKLIVFLDLFVTEDYGKLKESGLEPMLKHFGVDVKDEFPLRLLDEARDDPRELWATSPTESTIPFVRQFGVSRNVVLMPRTARIVAPAEQQGGRFKAEPILQLTFNPNWYTINEKNVKVLQDAQSYMLELHRNRPKLAQMLNRTPVPVAVAVRDTTGDKPCMVVFGDTEFITNRDISASRSRVANYSFLSGALDWLAEREDLSGAPPRVSENFSLKPTAISNAGRMIILPGWIMLLFIIGLGVTVWVVRRR